jgi:hypothetical protein
MVDIAHLGRISELAGCLVEHQRIVIPAVPKFAHRLQEFIGAVVARVMFQMLVKAEVARLGMIQRGHHVPGDTSGGQLIQCREQPRDVKGRVIGGGNRRAESQALGHRRHGGNHRTRFQGNSALTAIAHPGFQVVAVAVLDGQSVRQKQQIKLAPLQRAGDVLVVLLRQESIGRPSMAPRAMGMGDIAG